MQSSLITVNIVTFPPFSPTISTPVGYPCCFQDTFVWFLCCYNNSGKCDPFCALESWVGSRLHNQECFLKWVLSRPRGQEEERDWPCLYGLSEWTTLDHRRCNRLVLFHSLASCFFSQCPLHSSPQMDSENLEASREVCGNACCGGVQWNQWSSQAGTSHTHLNVSLQHFIKQWAAGIHFMVMHLEITKNMAVLIFWLAEQQHIRLKSHYFY